MSQNKHEREQPDIDTFHVITTPPHAYNCEEGKEGNSSHIVYFINLSDFIKMHTAVTQVYDQ